MESHLNKAIAAAALFLALLGVAQSAAAYGTNPSAGAISHDDAVDVLFVRQLDGTALGRAHSDGGSCQWHASLYYGTAPNGQSSIPVDIGPAPSPDHQLYIVWCGTTSGFYWLGPANFADGAIQGQIDQRLRQVSLVPAGVNVRPDNRGVTGIPSLFWVEGYGTAPLQWSMSEFGLTVNVTATLTDVEWDFGDGTAPVHAGLGEAWPQHSSVRHSYRDRSGVQPYRVTARLTFRPTFTVNGAAGAALEPIVVPVTRDYVVHEVQSVGRR